MEYLGINKKMTEDELNKLLGGEDLEKTLDVKTLVLDIVRKMDDKEILAIFREKLPNMTEEHIKDYYYMRRG